MAQPYRAPRHLKVQAAVEAPARPSAGGAKRGEGHSALLQGLGQVGDVAPSHMPWLLRLAHIRCRHQRPRIPRIPSNTQH